MEKIEALYLIGAAIGLGAQDNRCSEGPLALQQFGLRPALLEHGLKAYWQHLVRANDTANEDEVLAETAAFCTELASHVKNNADIRNYFGVIGGDHSSAIGTWSGAYAGIKEDGPLGLIWIDAHLDAHTFDTTPSNAIHGMPLASLLGYGDDSLTHIMGREPKILPEHVCVLGVRSFEDREVELLNNLGVQIFYMAEVESRGIDVVMTEALELVKLGTAGYGVTIDLDALDPEEVPGVGSPVPGGFKVAELCTALKQVTHDPQFLGFEIAEFNPHLNRDQLTEQAIVDLIVAMTLE